MNSRILTLLAAVALTAPFACLDSDSGAPSPGPDAGEIPSAADASTTSGADAATQPPDASEPPCKYAPYCLNNSQCAADKVCHSFGESLDERCCVVGTRGTGAVGTTCAADDECAFGDCIERDDGAKFCSGDCEANGDADCPTGMFCSSVFKWCVPRDVNAPVELCSDVGLESCQYNDNCPSTHRCQNMGTAQDTVYCCKAGDRGTKPAGEACADETECAFGRCEGGLCSADCSGGAACPTNMECDLYSEMCKPKA